MDAASERNKTDVLQRRSNETTCACSLQLLQSRGVSRFVAHLREDGYDPEGFPYCPSDKHQDLEQLSTESDIADFIQNQRWAVRGLRLHLKVRLPCKASASQGWKACPHI